MKTRTRNIIAISVAAVAALSIVFVVVLAVIRIKPLDTMLDCESYQIRYGQNYLTGDGNTGLKIDSRKNVNRKYESTTMDDLVNMCGFSVFKAWSQFKYDFNLRLADEDTGGIGKDEIKTIFDGTSAKLEKKFSFVFSFKEARTLEVKDSDDTAYSQSYDTAVVVLTESNGWVGNVKMYIFEYAKVYGSPDNSQIGSSEVGYRLFYPVQFGAVTSEAIDTMYDVFNIDPDADTTPPEEEETDEGSEETEA